jgi:predicted metal-dependent hydrolase
LNRSLLFLPPPLVRHVFLHELCHVKRLDHSPVFWRILQEMEPNSKALEAEIKKADKYVPPWVSLGKSR